jgi:general secretion pathway protein A
MDLARFGLKRRPFPPTPDAELYYPGTPHEQALASLFRAIDDDEGMAILIGEPGTGKTLVGHIFAERLGATAECAFLPHGHYENTAALLQSLLYDLGLPHDAASEQSLRLRLTDHALKTCADGKRLVAIVDEAHLLSIEILEELRLLGNLEAGRKAFQVVCLAQPGIAETLKDAKMSALRQRVSTRVTLGSLPVEDAVDYLVHHVRVAGGQPSELFPDDALEIIARASHGVPRLLNQAAHRSLQVAESALVECADAECVLEALSFLGLDVGEIASEDPILAVAPQRRSA